MITDGIKPGSFYRNKLNGIVLIAGTVIADTSTYKDGYRYVDHRGSFYTATGTVNNTVFAPFDLVEEVNGETVPEHTMLEIRKAVEKLASPDVRKARTYRVVRKALPVFAGINLTLGYAHIVGGNRNIGAFSLIVGTLGVAMHAVLPNELGDD